MIGGGYKNEANAGGASVLGGCHNCVGDSACDGAIGGGCCNTVTSVGGVIVGGLSGCATATNATVLGGKENRAAGACSIVGGCGNRSTHSGGHILGTRVVSVSGDMVHANRLFLSAGGLPTTDPGVPGVVWLSGGGAAALGSYHLMISNP